MRIRSSCASQCYYSKVEKLSTTDFQHYRLSAISASRRGLAQRRHRRSGRKTFSRRPQRDAEIVDLDSAIDEQLTPGQ